MKKKSLRNATVGGGAKTSVVFDSSCHRKKRKTRFQIDEVSFFSWKKQSSGFTLAELLAVIVILAIILIIAVPGVLGIINKAKKDAWVNSAAVLLNTMKTDHQVNGVKEKTEYSVKNNKIIRKATPQVPSGEVPFEGKYEKTGEVTIDEKGKIVAAFSNDQWCAWKTVKDTKLQVKDGDCDLSIFDTTPPVIKQFVSTGSTSNSITVSLTCEDPETRIIGYQYSKDGGKTYTDRVEESIYTFDKLKSGNYQLKGKCINKAELVTESEVIEKSTVEVEAPTYSINPSGDVWAPKKTVTITYPERQSGYVYQYSLNGGSNWITVDTGITKEIEFTSNGSVIARIYDGTNYKNGSSYSVGKVDSTAPAGVSVTIGTRTSSSIQVIANGSDAESGITNYEFSIDGGSYVSNGTHKTYTFTKVTSGNHTIKVRVTNGAGLSVESGETPTAPIELTAPVYTVTPSGDVWAPSKTVTITYPERQSGYIYQYSLNGGSSWIEVTSGTSVNIDFTNNGSVVARIYDGTNYKTGSSYSVGKVDSTPPTGVSVGIGTKTTNSIQVIANGSDSGSDITNYEFSIDEGTYVSNGTNNMYTFTKVTTGSHTIKIRLTNGSGLQIEASTTATVNDIETPTYSISPAGDVWAASKTVTITYPPRQSGFVYQYSTNGGSSWETVSSGSTKTVTFTNNGNVIARVNDGTNYKTASTYSVGKIDSTAPTDVSISVGTKTTNSIQVTASGSDAETGVSKYEFSIDGGSYINNGTINTRTLTGVTAGNHTITVRVTNGVGLTTEANTVASPNEITAPTYSISPSGDIWTTSKTVTITYPPRQSGFVYQYSVDKGNKWNTVDNGTTKEIEFTNPGIVIARIYDGTNYKVGSSYSATKVGYESCFSFTPSTGTVSNYIYYCPKTAVIPSTIGGIPVTSIGNSTFRETEITSVTIPNSVTTIGDMAFASNQLTSVTIPNSVMSIGDSAFYKNNLTSVTIGNRVTSIGSEAFYDNQLTSVTIPDSVKTIESYAFYKNKLTNVVIGNGVITIGNAAFRGNQIASVTLGNSVKTIESYAFSSNKLTSVILPDSVTEIGSSAFEFNQLTSVTIPNNVKTIESQTFFSNKLESVTIPSSVTEIQYNAFQSNQLTSVTIPDSVMSIGYRAFAKNQLTSITIPPSVIELGHGAFAGNQVSESQAFIYNRNMDGSEDRTTLNSYSGAIRDNVVIPNNVVTIGDKAFENNQLTSVTIPFSVKIIGNGAFSYNKLTNIAIPNSVTSIGNDAFRSNQLTSVTIPNEVTTIGDTAFYNNSLTSVIIKGKTALSEFTSLGYSWYSGSPTITFEP